jgi:bacillolysin
MKSKETKFRTLKIQLAILVVFVALIIPIITALAQMDNRSETFRETGDRSRNSERSQPDERLRSLPQDVQTALSQLPRDVEIHSLGPDRLPTMITSDGFGTIPEKTLSFRSDAFGQTGEAALNNALRETVLTKIAAVFRLTPDELELQTVRRIKNKEAFGENGKGDTTIVVYRQIKNNLPVVGGELAVVIDQEGRVKTVSSTARGGQDVDSTPDIAEETVRETTLGYAGEKRQIEKIGDGQLVYLLASRDYALHLTYMYQVTGIGDNEPFTDLIFTDADTNQVVDVHAQIHSALNRRIYSANNTFNLPGAARRFEGQGPNADGIVNTNYDYLGVTYNWYFNLFGRNSFNNQGAIITSSVHVGVSYVNAFWNGSQLAFGDGDGQQSSNLANSLDVTAHEFTHAVTQHSSGLIYQNESGALNEAWSDIFGAVVEARQTLGATGYNANTWKVGEDVWTPFIGGDALRYMDDPVRDNASRDYYPLRYVGGLDNGGVHWNSGIANLAFKLTVTGGMHPRGRNNVQVQGIGIDKARQIYYRAGVVYLRPNSNFEQARAATAQAAQDLYGRCNAEYVAVQRAWDAVAVPGTWRCGGGGGGDIHFYTYDNKAYDWHGGGCYDVAQSSNPVTSGIRFQMDAVAFAPNPGTSVARRVGFTFPDTSRPYIIILNRTAPHLYIKTPVGGADTRISIVGDVNQSATIRFYENGGAGRLFGTIVVYRHSNGVYEYFAQYANGTDVRAYVSPNVVVDASLQPGWNVALRGLAGVYPVQANLLSRGGQAYSVSTLRTNVTALNQFATSWACPSGQSLFDAPAGFREQESIPNMNLATQPEAEQMCETAGVPRGDVDRFENCVFDVLTGGDEFGALMATHAGTVWLFENQSPPAAEPDPCAPPTPEPTVEPTVEPTPYPPVPSPYPTATQAPNEPAPPETAIPAELRARRTSSTSRLVICGAEPENPSDLPESPSDLPNTTLMRLFGKDSPDVIMNDKR